MRILCGLDPSYTGCVSLSAETVTEGDGEGEGDGDGEVEAETDERSYADRDRESERDREIDGINMEYLSNLHGESKDSRSRNSGRKDGNKHKNKNGNGNRDRDRNTFESGDRGVERYNIMTANTHTYTPSHTHIDSQSQSRPRPLWCLGARLYTVVSILKIFARFKKMLKQNHAYFFPQRGQVRRCVGWCSQEDALFEYLTVREHIELFDSLLGEQADLNSKANSATQSVKTDKSTDKNDTCLTGLNETGDIPFNITNNTENNNQNLTQIIESTESIENKRNRQEYYCHKYYPKKFLNFITSYFLESDSSSGRRLTQDLLISRLGMEDHSEKYALELSGTVQVFFLFDCFFFLHHFGAVGS